MSSLSDFVWNAGRRKESKSEFCCALMGGYVAGPCDVNAYLDPADGEFAGRYASLSGQAFFRPWSFVFRHFAVKQMSRLLGT
jgi:hypothetical protein